jgi:protein TonB
LGGAGDEITPQQRRWMVAGILGLHVAGLWGLLQINAVREAVLQAAPMFVSVIAAPTHPAPSAPSAPPAPSARPLPRQPPSVATPLPTPTPITAVPASPAPDAFTVPVAPPAPVPIPVVAAPPAPMVSAPAPPAPPPAPKVIPASAVQFAEAPTVVYPRQSRRNGEAGRVLVRAYVDTNGGLPRTVQINKSSGFARLDEAALAAVQKARFKPYTEGGQPLEGWALVPIDFELEK